MKPKEIQFATLPKGAELADMCLTISQDADCCAPNDTENYLEVSTPDGGGGKYLAISGRWAMESAGDIDGLAGFLKGVLSEIGEEKSAVASPAAECRCRHCNAAIIIGNICPTCFASPPLK